MVIESLGFFPSMAQGLLLTNKKLLLEFLKVQQTSNVILEYNLYTEQLLNEYSVLNNLITSVTGAML